ncbi:MAG: hypothetical protein Q7S87_04835 [Agitococcus sp.]|nr:hypothetical protein [Agitococcus sp.]
MTIDRPRLQNLANKKVNAEAAQIPVCSHCGQSASFSFNISIDPPTKTCREPSCGVITSIVSNEKQGEAA